ncbi:hypothetical protein FRC03_000311, partial [Tulasnella sp. 419]
MSCNHLQIDLMLNSCIEVGENNHECASLSEEAIDSLSKIKEFLQHQVFCPQELQNSLSEFERELILVNTSLASLMKPPQQGVLGGAMSKIKELYNADDIKNELVRLRQKVQTRQQELQTWSTLRTESRVAVMHAELVARLEDQEASMKQLRKDLLILLPGLNPERKATLDRIEGLLPEKINAIDTNGSLRQELVRFQTRDTLQAA